MTDARRDDDLPQSREQGEARDLHDDALPDETLAALRSAWAGLPVPAPTRELDEEDEATRRAVGWMVAAWRSPEVVAPHVATAQHAPLALHARGVGADDVAPRLTGWRRQVAAAALIVALLGAALLLRDVPGIDAGRPAPGKPGPVAAGDPRDAPATSPATVPPASAGPSTAAATAFASAPVPGPSAVSSPAPAPTSPRATLPLLASASPPPIELRAGHTRVLLFTESTRRTQEIQP